MAVLLGILNFLFSAIAIFSTGLFVLSCINSLLNPTFPEVTEKIEGKKDVWAEKYDKLRFFLLLIMSISWGVVIAL